MASKTLCETCRQIPFDTVRNPTKSELAGYLSGPKRTPTDRHPFTSKADENERRVHLGKLLDILARRKACKLCDQICNIVMRRQQYTDTGHTWDAEDVSIDIKPIMYGRYVAKDREPVLFLWKLSITAKVGREENPRLWDGYFDECFQSCDVQSDLGVVDDLSESLESPTGDPMVFSGRKRPLVANLNWVTSWIKICDTEERHKSCRPTNESRDRFKVEAVRMIDVQQRCVTDFVDAQLLDLKYAALSYVWGRSQKTTLSTKNVDYLKTPGALKDPMLAKTIVDALLLAQKLEIKYLWTDALCIIQNDKGDKAKQIVNMDAIYSGAYLTFVAASGSDSSAGLPGLREGTRKYVQEEVLVIDPGSSQAYPAGMSLLTSVAPDSHRNQHYTVTSVWDTRGWTFQERVLSPRTLIFTPDQIYWACNNATYCEESFREVSEPRLLPLASAANELTLQQTFPNYGSSADERNRFWSQYQTLVRRYTQRVFSYEGDIYDGFTGITKALSHIYPYEQFIWGVPQSRFEMGLTWSAFTAQSRRTALSTLEMTSKKERVAFPTWSWMGWRGEANFRVDNDRYETVTPEITCYACKKDSSVLERISSEVNILNEDPNEPVSMEDIDQELPNFRSDGVMKSYPDDYLVFFWTQVATFKVLTSKTRTEGPKILDSAGNVVGDTSPLKDEYWKSDDYGNGPHEFAMIARQKILDFDPETQKEIEKLKVLVLQLKRNKDGTVERLNIGDIDEAAWGAAKPQRRLLALR